MIPSTDFWILWAIVVGVLAFVMYEQAGLDLPDWHTISYYSQFNAWLFWGILAAFPTTGIGLAIWWWFHIHGGIAK